MCKRFIVVLISVLTFTPLLSTIKNQEHCSFYKSIEQHCLVAVPWVDEEWPNERMYDYLMRCMRYQCHPQEAKKRRAAFKILCASKIQDPSKPSKVLDDIKTWIDLCLFYGQYDAELSLLSCINRTHTELGKATLSGMLVQPITDVEQLRRRQKLIKRFVEDPVLLNKVEAILQTFAKHENIIMSFWLQDQFRQAAKRHYFNIPYFSHVNDLLNNNPTALGTKVFLEHNKRIGWFLSTMVAAIVLPLYGASRLARVRLPDDVIQAANYLRSSGGPSIGLLMFLFKNKTFQGLATMFSGAVCGLSAKEDYEWARDNVVLTMCLQEKMIAVADCLRALKDMEILLKDNVLLRTGLPMAGTITDFLYQAPYMSPDLKRFDELMATDTFATKAQALSHPGRILVAYELMHELKHEWVHALVALGELDAYVGMAKLYKEFEHQPQKYCFAEFIERETPCIELRNFWNPFVKVDRVVPNSIKLGGDVRSNMILTGPNAGGKSTLLRGIALNLILAQTFGISPAQEVTITPFATIATYLNITDDITAGTSLFKAEVLRAQYIIDKVRNLAPGQHSFIIVDEMFSGTSPKEGEAAAYSVAKHLGTYKNSMCIIATHYGLLTKLEQETPFFANYKVTVDIKPDGTISYPFTLTPGASHQNIAIDMLKAEGFASSILDEAHALVNGTTPTTSRS